MTKHVNVPAINRRRLLKAAGLTFALTIAPDALSVIGDAFAEEAKPAPYKPNVWLTIAPDGTITVVSPAAEMGQGSFTTLPLIIAEELDADWAKVRPVFPTDWDDKKYGNPIYGYTFQTSASSSVTGYFTSLRVAGAQVRRVLIDAVAAKWNVPAGELSTEPSVVVHKASGRRIGYGEIAMFATAPAELPKIGEKDLKPTRKLSADRQGYRPYRRAAESRRRCQIRHGCPGARHGLRRGVAIALCGRRAA